MQEKEILSYEQLESNILEWADEKGLLKYENAPNQYLKFLEEVGETAKAILKNDVPEIQDGFGDIAVTIIILNKQLTLWQKYSLEYPKSEIDSEKIKFQWFIGYISDCHVSPKILIRLDSLSSSYGYRLIDCLNLAWNTIKNRTGKTKDGIFIKNA